MPKQALNTCEKILGFVGGRGGVSVEAEEEVVYLSQAGPGYVAPEHAQSQGFEQQSTVTHDGSSRSSPYRS